MLRHFHRTTIASFLGLFISACGSSNTEITPISPADPAKNTAIASLADAEQVQPKIVANADGSWWISWFSRQTQSTAPQGYDVYLQRLNADGKKLLASQGLEVAKLGVSWTEDYGLASDAQNNALLSFQDDRNTQDSGIRAITASKSDKTGKLQWSTATSASGHSPHIAALPNGQSILGWTVHDDTDSHATIHLQKLDATGQPLSDFPKDLVLAEADNHLRLADLQAAEDGTVIISFVRENPAQNTRHLYANKISQSAQLLWGSNHLKVFDGGSLQMGSFPRFVLDGRGGAVFTWYSTDPQLQVYAQHVQSQGSISFAHNGAAVSTDLQQARTAPSVSYQAATGEITLFWTELSDPIFQRQRGLYAQKFNTKGERQWGETGLILHPVGDEDFTHLHSIAVAGGTLAFWVHANAESKSESIQAIKLNASGAVACPEFAVSTRPSIKSKLALGASKSGVLLLAWEDQSEGQIRDIYAQSVTASCQLGAF